MKYILLISIFLSGCALGQGNAVNGKGGGITDPTAFRHALGVGTGDSPTFTGINLSGQTASSIVGFDASKNIISLSTATYPSLTEFSYVKGLTGALQTQLNSKLSLSGGPMSGSIQMNSNDITAVGTVQATRVETGILHAGGDLTVPNATGTLALTSDLLNYVGTSGNQTMSGILDAAGFVSGNAAAELPNGFSTGANVFMEGYDVFGAYRLHGDLIENGNGSSYPAFTYGAQMNDALLMNNNSITDASSVYSGLVYTDTIYPNTGPGGSIDLYAGEFKDVGNFGSLSYFNRYLLDISGFTILDWSGSSVILTNGADFNNFDATNINTVQATSGYIDLLQGNSNFNGTIDLANGVLIDSSLYNSLDFSSRTLFDSNGMGAIDWSGRELLDGGGNVSTSWNDAGIESKSLRFLPTAVASLPTPAEGQTAYVNDATAPVVGNTVVGGGAAKCLVVYNGTNWIVITIL